MIYCCLDWLAREDEKQKVKKMNEQLMAERKLLEQKASQLVEMAAVGT